MIFLLLTLATLAASEPILLGELREKKYGVGGQVYAVDEYHILIKGVTYDGLGPDAFFWVGTEGVPGKVDGDKTLILTEDKHYAYRDKSAPVLGAYKGQDVTLVLPSYMKLSSLKWLSVWCRKHSVDFGNVIFPNNFKVPGINSVSEMKPESESGHSKANGNDASGFKSSVIAIVVALVYSTIFL